MGSVLLIGGAGYIGSHMVRNLVEKKLRPIVFDNLSTGFKRFVPPHLPFIQGDLRNYSDIKKALVKHKVETVFHFASSIIVPESVKSPLKYYDNNVSAFVNLTKAMNEAGTKQIIFSSTAAVYGEAKTMPIREDSPTAPQNPYGHTKWICEQILQDLAVAQKDFSFVALRYFNVAGAHVDGGIGESHEPETHLIPIVLEVVSGKRPHLEVYGNNYATPDGTCIRDYIHVQDLAEAHYLAFKNIRGKARNQIFNLGNQTGFSVKQVIAAAEKVVGQKLKVKIRPRRPGDTARLVASSAKAKRLLGWVPRYGLDKMIATAWAWEQEKS